MIRRLTCPICEKELPVEVDSEAPLFPFCSKRCKQIDLHRWTSGGYAIVEDLTPDKMFEHLSQRELPPDEQ